MSDGKVAACWVGLDPLPRIDDSLSAPAAVMLLRRTYTEGCVAFGNSNADNKRARSFRQVSKGNLMMDIYKKTEALARKLEAEYPDDLAGRLQWWSKRLGIDRVRLLRMIGASEEQAKARKSERLEKVLKDPAREADALMIEGGLHRLLALFPYDWQALAEQLHQSATEQRGTEIERVARRKGEVKRLPYRPNGDASELLLNRMAEGGPQLLSSLFAYLAESPAGKSRAET